MFKRVERKRKMQEEDDELGIDQDMKETVGLVDTDSDESDSGSEHDTRSDDLDADADIGQDGHQEEHAASEDEGSDEEPPISVAEALKDPIYLISLDPTVHGCMLCKEKLIKSAGMSTAHKNANLHKRRFEHFKRLAAQADPHSNAWELVSAISSVPDAQEEESQGLSKRALKRQVKQAAIHEKRKHHKELKAKAIAKKTLKKLSMAGETNPAPSAVYSRSSPVLQNQQEKPPKRRKVESNTSNNTTMRTREATAKPASRTKTSSGSKKSVLKSRLKGKGKAAKPS